MARALANCPFCHSHHLHVQHKQGYCHVVCDHCGCGGPQQVDVEDAIARWNQLGAQLQPLPAPAANGARGAQEDSAALCYKSRVIKAS